MERAVILTKKLLTAPRVKETEGERICGQKSQVTWALFFSYEGAGKIHYSHLRLASLLLYNVRLGDTNLNDLFHRETFKSVHHCQEG